MSSGLPLRADIVRCSRHVSNGPKPAMLWLSRKFLLGPQADGRAFMSTRSTHHRSQRHFDGSGRLRRRLTDPPEDRPLQNRHNGQFAHRGHAKIARRVTLSQRPVLAENQNMVPYARQPASRRGTLRPIVTKREAGCGGRHRRARRSARDAFDEAVWSRHPDAGVKLARATVTTEPGTPRRARNKSSNIARGMPDVSGCTCGLLVCVLFAQFLHTSLRVQRHPAFPAPFLKGRRFAEPGQIMPREGGSSSWRPGTDTA
jgi:hypothetical protein